MLFHAPLPASSGGQKPYFSEIALKNPEIGNWMFCPVFCSCLKIISSTDKNDMGGKKTRGASDSFHFTAGY